MSDREIIDRDGERFVLVPERTYDRMIEDLDELDNIRAYDRAKAEPQEFVPAEIVDQLLAGENPIRVWREYRGLTQQALADATGISKPYLSQLEGGLREPSIGVLRKLAMSLSLDLDDLVPTQKRAQKAARRKAGAKGTARKRA